MKIMTSGEVARQLGISRERLFYYEDKGKISMARRTGTGKRYFFPSDVEKLRKFFEGVPKHAG